MATFLSSLPTILLGLITDVIPRISLISPGSHHIEVKHCGGRRYIDTSSGVASKTQQLKRTVRCILTYSHGLRTPTLCCTLCRIFHDRRSYLLCSIWHQHCTRRVSNPIASHPGQRAQAACYSAVGVKRLFGKYVPDSTSVKI